MLEEYSSCKPNVNALGVSMFRWGLLAAFFNEMIILDTITGINLTRTKPLSHASLIFRARSISHAESSAGGKEIRTIIRK